MCFLIQVVKDIKVLHQEFEEKTIVSGFQEFKESRERNPEMFKKVSDTGHVYPNYFCPILTKDKDDFHIRPMRYRVRPNKSSSEIPSKFNVFNARKDSLLVRKTWKPLLGQGHGIVVLKRFYEWVIRDGKKTLISFYPKNQTHLYVPVLYDFFECHISKEHFYSFAIITDEPPREVLEAGHDRVPICLTKEHAIKWSNSKTQSREQWISFLDNKSDNFFLHDIESVLPEGDNKKKQLELF